MDGVTHQPYKVPTEDIEDARERQLMVNLARWFIFEVMGLLRSPFQLAIFYSIILWPVGL
jgi:hypothetical protein